MIIDLTPVRDRTGPARLLDMVEGRSPAVFQTWLSARPQAWRDAIEVVAMDGFTGFKTATVAELPAATTVMDPFHVIRLAGDALDRARRRVQQDLHGHRGRARDPLYRARRTLHTGRELLTDRQKDRLEQLFAVEDHASVEVTWAVYQRMVAALTISAEVRSRNGLVLLLSGTPILNRPTELITQLQCVNRLHDVTPAPRKRVDEEASWEYAFKFAYCGAEKKDSGHWEFTGASNLDRLNALLRQTCYVRRLRSDVLNLDETHRVEVQLSLNGNLAEYRHAETNFLDYLRSTGGNVSAAVRAEVLAQINALRRLAGEAKVEAATSWIADFLEENPDKKLVVFAWHQSVQRKLAKAVGGICLIDAKDIEAAKWEFNEGEARVIVCSLQAHREGHTLVGNSFNVTDVLFVENPWHAGAKSQAEDRINRIGRKAAAVFSWTLLADCQIDEWLNNLVESKRIVARGAADGFTTDDQASGAVLTELAAKFAARAAS